MKSKLALLFFLFALSFDGLVPARATQPSGQGQALPLQNDWSQGFLFATLNSDGVNPVRQRRKRRRPRKSAQKAKPKVYAIQMEPAAPAPAETGADLPVGSSPPPPGENTPTAPAKKSAPRIKPPTVMIKPPTE